jgi:hypothetical protein
MESWFVVYNTCSKEYRVGVEDGACHHKLIIIAPFAQVAFFAAVLRIGVRPLHIGDFIDDEGDWLVHKLIQYFRHLFTIN